jgi:signal peptidase I
VSKPKSAGGQVIELVVIVVTALALALAIQQFLVKPYRIPSSSMVPTLAVGERVLVNRIELRFTDPSVGDVVVFHPPSGAENAADQCGTSKEGEGQDRPCGVPTRSRSSENFIKRIVAGPGDTLAIKDGHAIVNGVPAKEPFIRPCAPGRRECNFPKPITIPADHYFMMGDNRGESDDSRYWGPVPDKWIIGGAFATYWPPKRIGIF